MSYQSKSSFDEFNRNQYPKDVGLTDEEREKFISQVRSNNRCFKTEETIRERPGYFDYLHTCALYKKSESSIAVGIAHIKYRGTGSDVTGHAVVIVKDTEASDYHIINFNSHLIQNTDTSQSRYITDGPLAKKQGNQNVPNISSANHLVTQNLQGAAPICTLIAASILKLYLSNVEQLMMLGLNFPVKN